MYSVFISSLIVFSTIIFITLYHVCFPNTNQNRAVHGYVDLNVKLAKGAANIAVSSATTAKNIAVHGGEKAYDVVAPLVGLKKPDAAPAAEKSSQ